MAEPKAHELGNAADELAAYENGKDFLGMNRGPLPDAPTILEASVEQHGTDIVILPDSHRKKDIEDFDEYVLSEGKEDIVLAQIADDPEMESIDELVGEGLEWHGTVATKETLALRTKPRGPREQLIFYGVTPSTGQAMLGDRVLVRQDMRDSIYACRKCRGNAYLPDECPCCKGTRFEGEFPCRLCRVQKFATEMTYNCGHVVCDLCKPQNGIPNGWRAGIIIPETLQSMPITGVVVSLGPKCELLRLGDWVLHSRYGGTHVDTNEGERYTTLHESEVMGLLKDLTELRNKLA